MFAYKHFTANLVEPSAGRLNWTLYVAILRFELV